MVDRWDTDKKLRHGTDARSVIRGWLEHASFTKYPRGESL